MGFQAAKAITNSSIAPVLCSTVSIREIPWQHEFTDFSHLLTKLTDTCLSYSFNSFTFSTTYSLQLTLPEHILFKVKEYHLLSPK